jgi:hypothetical protein
MSCNLKGLRKVHKTGVASMIQLSSEYIALLNNMVKSNMKTADASITAETFLKGGFLTKIKPESATMGMMMPISFLGSKMLLYPNGC